MKLESVLLPLDGSPEAAKAASCALWLARALGATLHVVHVRPSAAQLLPAADVLEWLRVPQLRGERVVVHQCTGDAGTAVLETMTEHRIDLVVMSARGESAPLTPWLVPRVGSIARSVIEHASVPVVLLPARYRESLPWQSILVAASGEAAADRALESTMPIAAALRLQVTALHCEDGDPKGGETRLASYADEPHHEYAQRLEHMVRRGLAHSSADEVRWLCGLLLRHGDPASALIEHVAASHASVLALGWHGRLSVGRARVLKHLLEQAECALLIVRETSQPRTRLKVGREFG